MAGSMTPDGHDRNSTFRRLAATVGDTIRYVRGAQLPLSASSLAYITLLTIVPLIALSFSIFKAFGGMQMLYRLVEPIIIENLTPGAGQEAVVAIRRFVESLHAGALGLTGLLGVITTTMIMLYSAEKAINRVWNVPMKHTLVQRLAIYWFFITLGPLAIGIALGVLSLQIIPFLATSPEDSNYAPGVGTGPILLITAILFFLIYKWVPNYPVRTWPAVAAAIFASAAWNLARYGYVLYTRHFVTQSQLYGSLGAIPILLVWIYISWLIILVGAAYAAASQKGVQKESEHADKKES